MSLPDDPENHAWSWTLQLVEWLANLELWRWIRYLFRRQWDPPVKIIIFFVKLQCLYLVEGFSRDFTSTVIASTNRPFSHKFKLSKPTNQSGEGTNLDINETLVWFPSRKTFALVSPAPDSMGGAENPSKTTKSPCARSPSLVCCVFCLSKMPVLPSWANSLTAKEADSPNRNKW